MATFISVETDIDEALHLLDTININSKKLTRKILSGVGSSTKNKIKKSYKSLLKKNTGNLYQSISRGIIASGKAVIIQPKARGTNQVFYGYALAKGSIIFAKNQKNLTFKIGDKWIKKQSIKLPQRDWFEAPANKYIGSEAYKQQIDRIVQKELDNYDEKVSKGTKV